jgi:predicted CoA-substrate-specific enzyme activase
MRSIGIDIGSVTVSLVIVDEGNSVIANEYIRHKGKPLHVARDLLQDLVVRFEPAFIATTGIGAKTFASLIGASFINEIVALSRSFSRLYPTVRSIVDIGGEDSKLITVEPSSLQGTLRVTDFSMNTLCAAGTGSFLDQQASRLRFSIEEFSQVALKSQSPPRIAGRCTVFAKSDMIHLQQIATPDYEIVAGLCYALARNFKSNITKGKDVINPVAFVGGVAANAGMRRALRDVFELSDGEFFVPRHFTAMSALGAVFAVLDDPVLMRSFAGLDELDRYLVHEQEYEAHEQLEISEENLNVTYDMKTVRERTRAYLGVDVGSISTNLVLIDEDRNVLAKRYLMTEGRPLDAVMRGLAEIGEEINDKVDILGAGTTGSGRYLTADFIGADIVRNEITAQAEAAIAIDPQVDTIFEIGGQDSKFISIDNGVIVDFEMNKACAAGTGSFLEEQAERLGISIKEQFGELALSARNPVRMGERCTVFIESDVVHHQQRGMRIDDIVSGLSYSIVANYLNKVVGDRRVADRIFFQGGTAFNKGVVAAFEKVLKRPITVPPHHDVTGAIGVAILSMKERTWEKSTFKGFDLSKRQYKIDTFECKGCENLCEIRRVTVEDEKPLYYGSRCEKYDVVRRVEKSNAIDLFRVREELLHTTYDKAVEGEVIGIPRALYMHEMLPFWKAFLSELGYCVVLSDATNNKIVREGAEKIIVEACFPVKLAHGHVLNLIQKGVKRLFIPSVINLKKFSEEIENSFACPYAQTIPYTLGASIDFAALGVTVDSPVVYLGHGREAALKNLQEYGRKLGKSRREVERAHNAAIEAQELFHKRCLEEGSRFLSNLESTQKIMVIVGRPYNSCDGGANLNIHRKLADLGVPPIPLDMLPLSDETGHETDLEHMYWGYGQKILRGARVIRNQPNLYAIYVTNFGCGPDSFITHFFKRIMKSKPFLQLEIDEHSADAGAVTRLEAFLDSIKNAKPGSAPPQRRMAIFEKDGNRRKIYIPPMSDHARVLASAFRACGVDAEMMPESDRETVLWGRKFTTGKECYPCALTTGDMIKAVRGEGFDPERSAFFMPSGSGPCRFGQYHRFHRMVLDDLGFENVPIYAPNQDHRFYKELNIVGGKFSRLGWLGIVAVDMMTKMLHEVRPHERNKGDADEVYRKSLELVCTSLERGGSDLVGVLKGASREYLGVEKGATKKPVVGIVGEIYIRSNRFSNDFLIRQIEDLGGVVWLAPLAEWISYVNLMARRRDRKKTTLSEFIKLLLTDYVQRRDEHGLEEIFKDYIKYGSEPKITSIIEKASPYVHVSFEGEAILSVGKAVDFIDKGVAGVINAMPFTCMPGTISSALMRLIQKKYNVPILNVAYDGQGAGNITTRLEAFMYQVKDGLKSDG